MDADRELLARLAGLAGRAEALAATTGFRFFRQPRLSWAGAGTDRPTQRARASADVPASRDFMERRLAPAMRTAAAAAERQREVIARVARTTQMLAARVDIAAEATNASLLKSMDRRAQLQLRLQETVEGLSAAAISYYALGLLKFVVEGLDRLHPGIDPAPGHRRGRAGRGAAGLAVPAPHLRHHILQDHEAPV